MPDLRGCWEGASWATGTAVSHLPGTGMGNGHQSRPTATGLSGYSLHRTGMAAIGRAESLVAPAPIPTGCAHHARLDDFRTLHTLRRSGPLPAGGSAVAADEGLTGARPRCCPITLGSPHRIPGDAPAASSMARGSREGTPFSRSHRWPPRGDHAAPADRPPHAEPPSRRPRRAPRPPGLRAARGGAKCP